MSVEKLIPLLAAFRSGHAELSEVLAALGNRAIDDGTASLPEATVDLDRRSRCGFPEVIYGEGKTPDAVRDIAKALRSAGQAVLATRATAEQAAAVQELDATAEWSPIARTIRIGRCSHRTVRGRVAVLTAGTTDQPVAEEAISTLFWMGLDPVRIVDVGVAGPQRLLEHLPTLRSMKAVIVVAGMEGALPSVVGGHLDVPVIAVPTSVGYGSAFGGVTALLGMLNSCASNVTVVNIDAGFKAAYIAGLIATDSSTEEHEE